MTVTVVDAGSRKVSGAVEVSARAAEIFDIVADPHRHGELDGSGTVMDGRGRTATTLFVCEVLGADEAAQRAVPGHQTGRRL